MKRTLAALVVVWLAGCGTQPNAGMTSWDMTWKDGKLESVRIRDGKEKANVQFSADLNTGRAQYSATDVTAFEGQAIQAELGKAWAEQFGAALSSEGWAVIRDVLLGQGVPIR